MFNSSRGGHAPNDLRDHFAQQVETGQFDQRLLGRLWNCTDILPAEYCDMLELRPGSSYAKATRKVKTQIA